jgi:acyl carrier protein
LTRKEPLEAFQVDSLTLLEFVMAVEEEFNVEIDEDEVSAIWCGW